MRSLRIVVLATLLGATVVPVLRAHHSYADFDVDRRVAVDGVIERVLFANPHVVLTVRTADRGLMTVTWMSAGQLTRQGVREDLFRVGDQVAVSGSPSRVATELSRIDSVLLPKTGWHWQRRDGQLSITGG